MGKNCWLVLIVILCSLIYADQDLEGTLNITNGGLSVESTPAESSPVSFMVKGSTNLIGSWPFSNMYTKIQVDGLFTDYYNKTQVDASLALKENTISSGTTNQFYSWNKTWQLITWNMINSKPTTISGYGITDAYIKSEVDALLAGKETTISSGTASQFYAWDKSWKDLAWSYITNKPTTISGYGIIDAYTKTEINTSLSGKENTISSSTASKFYAWDKTWKSLLWSYIGSTPTTISGYGITDAYTKTEIDNSLLGKENSLGNPGTNGFLLSSTTAGVRSWVAPYVHPTYSVSSPTLTGANVLSTLTLNNLGHITAVSTRTLAPSDISAVAANNAITAGTNTKITYDSKGLVTAGTSLAASDIPTLTVSKLSDIGTYYYTKTNMQTSGQALLHWGNLTNVPSSFTPSSHTLGSHSDFGTYINQEVKSTSSPTFSSLAITNTIDADRTVTGKLNIRPSPLTVTNGMYFTPLASFYNINVCNQTSYVTLEHQTSPSFHGLVVYFAINSGLSPAYINNVRILPGKTIGFIYDWSYGAWFVLNGDYNKAVLNDGTGTGTNSNLVVTTSYNGDLRSLDIPGIYSTEYNGSNNKPSGAGNGHFIQVTDADGNDVKTQFYINGAGDRIWFQEQWGTGAWRGWKEFFTSDNLDPYYLNNNTYVQANNFMTIGGGAEMDGDGTIRCSNVNTGDIVTTGITKITNYDNIDLNPLGSDYTLNPSYPRYRITGGNDAYAIRLGSGEDGQRVTITKCLPSGMGYGATIKYGPSNNTTCYLPAYGSLDFMYDGVGGYWTIMAHRGTLN